MDYAAHPNKLLWLRERTEALRLAGLLPGRRGKPRTQPLDLGELLTLQWIAFQVKRGTVHNCLALGLDRQSLARNRLTLELLETPPEALPEALPKATPEALPEALPHSPLCMNLRSKNKKGESKPTPEEPQPEQLTLEGKTEPVPPKKKGAGIDSATAERIVQLWNEHKPRAWSVLRTIDDKRWEVAQTWASKLGGMEAFLEALPKVLAAAKADSFWGSKGMSWNGVLGYGADTRKGHFLTLLEAAETRGVDASTARACNDANPDRSPIRWNPLGAGWQILVSGLTAEAYLEAKAAQIAAGKAPADSLDYNPEA